MREFSINSCREFHFVVNCAWNVQNKHPREFLFSFALLPLYQQLQLHLYLRDIPCSTCNFHCKLVKMCRVLQFYIKSNIIDLENAKCLLVHYCDTLRSYPAKYVITFTFFWPFANGTSEVVCNLKISLCKKCIWNICTYFYKNSFKIHDFDFNLWFCYLQEWWMDAMLNEYTLLIGLYKKVVM